MMALTSPMNARVSKANTRASLRACSCNPPSVFHTSQQAPSSPYPANSATPVSREKGVSQSHQPPA